MASSCDGGTVASPWGPAAVTQTAASPSPSWEVKASRCWSPARQLIILSAYLSREHTDPRTNFSNWEKWLRFSCIGFLEIEIKKTRARSSIAHCIEHGSSISTYKPTNAWSLQSIVVVGSWHDVHSQHRYATREGSNLKTPWTMLWWPRATNTPFATFRNKAFTNCRFARFRKCKMH